ncbi:MAG: peptidase S9 [Chloroflexi bacterium]|nr:MAG: peptidase S9 [Chloroflexota bacterium]
MKSPITIEDIATYPLPGTAVPGSLQFSPDNNHITYLCSDEGSLVQQLYALNLENGDTHQLVKPPGDGDTEENLSLEEKLRRERMRQHKTGITQYSWSKDGRILIPLPGGLFVQNSCDSELQQIAAKSDHPILDARFSPDGKWIAYVQNAEIYVVPSAGGNPRQLTSGARSQGKTNGLAEYIAQEEMARQHGYWWSPDSQSIAFAEVDETHIPVYRIIHQGQDSVGEEAQEEHRYPFAGKDNAKVRLGVIRLDSRSPTWMDLGDNDDIYLARVKWLPNGRLTAQIQNRDQSRLDLISYDPTNGTGQTLLSETSDVWINLHNLFHPLKNGRFIWGSERTGFMHLYLYDERGELQRPLTSGNWQVESIEGIDQKNKRLYFSGTLDSPLERHLYVVDFDGSKPRRLTAEAGSHFVTLDRRFSQFIDLYHSLTQPPIINLCRLKDGSRQRNIFTPNDPRLEKINLPTPEIVELTSRDGITLYGILYRPPATFGTGPFPTIVAVYGGPHVQVVANRWLNTANMRAQFLAQQGYLVFMLDNRGSSRRGLAFEGWIRQRIGIIEVQDQVDGVRWLVEQGLTDSKRVGIYGWSYGGYMSAMCLAQAPDTFKVAVSGAPVTHYDGYDTHYTERYLSTPQANPTGYAQGSVMHHVDHLKGKLLLIHGLIDENVHFRHTARLINALIKARKPYDLLLFPNERHSPRRLADRIYLEERVRDYFNENL